MSRPFLIALGVPLSLHRAVRWAFPEYSIILVPPILPVRQITRLLVRIYTKKRTSWPPIAIWSEDGLFSSAKTDFSQGRPALYLLIHQPLERGTKSVLPGAFFLKPLIKRAETALRQSQLSPERLPVLKEFVTRMNKAGYLADCAIFSGQTPRDFATKRLEGWRYAPAPFQQEEGLLATLLLRIAESAWPDTPTALLRQELSRVLEDIQRKISPSARTERNEPTKGTLSVEDMASALKRRDFDEAIKKFFSLRDSGRCSLRAVLLLAELVHQRFFFSEAAQLSRLGTLLSKGSLQKKFCLLWGRNALLSGKAEEGLAAFCFAFLRFGAVAEIPFPGYEGLLSRQLGHLPWQKAMAAAAIFKGNMTPLNLLRTLILAERFNEAGILASDYRPIGNKKQEEHTILSAELALLQGDSEKAWQILQKRMKRKSSSKILSAAAKYCLFQGDMQSGKSLWKEVLRNNLTLEPLIEYHLLLGLGLIHEAFIRHGRAKYFHTLDYYPSIHILKNLPVPYNSSKTLLVLAECFTGDEIRFSRLYPRIQEKSGAKKVYFACDPRMYSLFSRSFPQLNFVAVKKGNGIATLDDTAHWRSLPSVDCACYLDNTGWDLATQVQSCITVMQALPEVIKDYSSLEHLPYLVPDPARFASWQHRLAPYADKLLVGLGWRSSLRRYDRNYWGMSLCQLAPLLRLKQVQFVCCQYDGCTEEEEKFLSHLPPETLLRLNVDQMHDMEETAALYANLDMMVTAPMFTSELAGSLGVPSVIFSPSKRAAVFCRPGSEQYAFFPKSIFVYQNATDGNKIALLLKEKMKLLASCYLPDDRKKLTAQW